MGEASGTAVDVEGNRKIMLRLLKKYSSFKSSGEYDEKYKWEFIEKHKCWRRNYVGLGGVYAERNNSAASENF